MDVNGEVKLLSKFKKNFFFFFFLGGARAGAWVRGGRVGGSRWMGTGK